VQQRTQMILKVQITVMTSLPIGTKPHHMYAIQGDIEVVIKQLEDAQHGR